MVILVINLFLHWCVPGACRRCESQPGQLGSMKHEAIKTCILQAGAKDLPCKAMRPFARVGQGLPVVLAHVQVGLRCFWGTPGPFRIVLCAERTSWQPCRGKCVWQGLACPLGERTPPTVEIHFHHGLHFCGLHGRQQNTCLILSSVHFFSVVLSSRAHHLMGSALSCRGQAPQVQHAGATMRFLSWST